ncbi:MAG: hypothetical protein M3Y28_05140 [Armatimonadota bacterium]|nr:hypothetical protein [Armatimonadota bacterium]
MTDETHTWNLTSAQWDALTARVRTTNDALEDGALARIVMDEATGAAELYFYATALNKPADWRFPFLEPVPDSENLGAFVGRAWHEPETGFVQFEVFLPAAAQALQADYESGVADLDYVAYKQAVEQAVRGTEKDAAWLTNEFARLARLSPPD